MNRRNFLIIGVSINHDTFAQTLRKLAEIDGLVTAQIGNPHQDISNAVELMKHHHPKIIETYTNVQQAIDEIKKYKPDFDIEIVKTFAAQTSHSYKTLICGIRDHLSYRDRHNRGVDHIMMSKIDPPRVPSPEGYKIPEEDSRPWYEKAANPGGKKRKQNYNNRQPWRK